MWIKAIILIVSLPIAWQSKAQESYLVTTSNDTIVGQVKVSGFTTAKKIAIITNEGKRKYHFGDIHSYTQRGSTTFVTSEVLDNGRVVYTQLSVLVEGKVKLLHDLFYDNWVLYFMIHGKFIPNTPNNFTSHVWPVLMQCDQFAGTYKGVAKDDLAKWQKDYRKLTEVVSHYNAHCQ